MEFRTYKTLWFTSTVAFVLGLERWKTLESGAEA